MASPITDGPFGEDGIGRDDDGGALVEAGDQMEQQLASGPSEGQTAELTDLPIFHAREVTFRAASLP